MLRISFVKKSGKLARGGEVTGWITMSWSPSHIWTLFAGRPFACECACAHRLSFDVLTSILQSDPCPYPDARVSFSHGLLCKCFVDTMLRAIQDVVLPFSKPVRGLDGAEVTEVMVPKGSLLVTSLLQCNCNPEIWGADAQEWKPERWLKELPESVIEAKIPGIYAHLCVVLLPSSHCKKLTTV